MAWKSYSVIRVVIDKELVDTGQPGRPFFATLCQTMYVWFLGVLVFKITTNRDFPTVAKK
jgi:hypothetical protein